MEDIRKQNALRILCAVLAALLIPMTVVSFARSEQLDAANARIGAVWQKALYETCELTEAVAANYRKLLVTGDASRMQLLLGQISRETQGAAGDLALLPLGEKDVSATIKFINQAEDFAESLSLKLATKGALTDGDYANMETLAEYADAFSAGMESLLGRLEKGEAVFSAERSVPDNAVLYPLTGSAADYPVLLYDGPFSDGESTGSYALLQGMPEVSRVEAEACLRAFIPVDEIVFTGESAPELPCWEFRLRSGAHWIDAGVTRQGGQMLYLLPEARQLEARLSEAELMDIAEAFLLERGYGEVEMSYSSRLGGVLTINYAAVQDEVILYPDLVKIQLSMEDGSVIGLDAKRWLKNHRPRSIAPPQITQEEAMARISPRLTPISARLCIIPQSSAEYLCWEISAADESGDYLVYIDAASAVERELLQVVSRENGTLVI